ncbi:MAG: hypothetical protein QOF30_847 [Acidimicrobiaceae bacterium]|jgi:hypothetical protein|nr:hypothetical protein [Acidimicrobiaceae bacterium]
MRVAISPRLPYRTQRRHWREATYRWLHDRRTFPSIGRETAASGSLILAARSSTLAFDPDPADLGWHTEGVRRYARFATVALAALIVTGATACNPAIYRAEGTVVSVGPHEDATQVCLVRAIKAAGSTYGKSPGNGRICMFGVPTPAGIELPKVGDCVILENQGESSELKIERATNCSQ